MKNLNPRPIRHVEAYVAAVNHPQRKVEAFVGGYWRQVTLHRRVGGFWALWIEPSGQVRREPIDHETKVRMYTEPF